MEHCDMTATGEKSRPAPRCQPSRLDTTLLDLVWAVNQVTEDEQLVVATVMHLVNSGQARLIGTFKGTQVIVG
jgi:hypothetical protein